jgi:hypothetical protein
MRSSVRPNFLGAEIGMHGTTCMSQVDVNMNYIPEKKSERLTLLGWNYQKRIVTRPKHNVIG